MKRRDGDLALRSIQLAFPGGDADTVQRAQRRKHYDGNGETQGQARTRQQRDNGPGGKQNSNRRFLRGQRPPDQTERMVRDEIYYRSKTHHGADEKCLDRCGSPDDVSIEPSDESETRDPDFAVAKTKLLAKRPRHTRFQGNRVGEPIPEIDEPRGKEKRDGVPDLQRNRETAREQPKPRDRYQRRVQTNEVEPDCRNHALRSMRIPTSQRGGPTG